MTANGPSRAMQRALAEALRHEYESIVNAGILLQIDCPDLAMGRHSQYADLSRRCLKHLRRFLA